MSRVAQDLVSVLDTEMATFRKVLPNLLRYHRGRFVLINGDDVIGIYDKREHGLRKGYSLFLHEAFLVREILPEPGMVLYFSRCL